MWIQDALGRRISETHESDTTHYLYQGQCEIGAYFNGELRILGKGKGAELGAAIAIEIADKVYAPIHDHRGNVCCLVDCSACQPEQYYRYTAFGETISYCDVQNPWQYASKRFDERTGFHRFGKRDYDCRLGRWLTPDPAGFADGPNLYAYVHNRPMTLFDPWGLQSNYSQPIGKPGDRGSGSSRIRSFSSYCGAIGFIMKIYSKEIREGASRLAHKAYSDVSEHCSVFAEAQQYTHDLYDDFAGRFNLPQFSTNPMQNYNNGNAAVHEKIDQTFSTNYAADYAPEAIKNRTCEDLSLGMLPPPSLMGALSNRKNIERAAKAIENFLGGKGKVITNADGDMILIKGDRKVRFDVKHPHGDRPHFHMEERSSNGRWKDAGPEHRYYFQEE